MSQDENRCDLVEVDEDEWQRQRRQDQIETWDGMALINQSLDPVHSVHFARYLLALALVRTDEDEELPPLPDQAKIQAALDLLDRVPSYPPWSENELTETGLS